MANPAFQTGTDGQIFPLLNLNPAFPNVAALPDATKFPGRVVLLQASTSPGTPCLAISDGASWWPITFGNAVIS